MELRKIPNTDISVSSLCLGTMLFGNPTSREDAINIIHWALDNGINFIDTADMYEGYGRYAGSPGGVAEKIIGEALVGRRDKAVITTKVGNSIGGGDYEGRGIGRKHILHQIDASLQRLQTDYVDFYELHIPDQDIPLEESVDVMADLVQQGKVRYWGFSNFDASQIPKMLNICDKKKLPRPVIAEPSYNWLNREIEADYLPHCRDNDIAVTPYQALQEGLLTGKYHRGRSLPQGSRAEENPDWLEIDENIYDKLEAFEQEALQNGLTPAQYAVNWLLKQPGVYSVVVGAKRINQLKDLFWGV